MYKSLLKRNNSPKTLLKGGDGITTRYVFKSSDAIKTYNDAKSKTKDQPKKNYFKKKNGH